MAYTDSARGTASTALSNPIAPPPPSDSPRGTATATLRRPHHPIGTLTENGIEWGPILTFTDEGML